MKYNTISGLLTVACLVSALGQAQATGAYSTRLQLDRDPVLEQNLRYQASPDKTITPAKVLRWINSWMGYAPNTKPSDFEFQPIYRTHDNHHQIIAQIAYKF